MDRYDYRLLIEALGIAIKLMHERTNEVPPELSPLRSFYIRKAQQYRELQERLIQGTGIEEARSDPWAARKEGDDG
jgi:hypothetical protein